LKALGPHPLYVLIFALIFMPLVLCIYAFAAVASDDLKIATAGGFLLVVLVALLMLRSLEVGKQRVLGLQAQIEHEQERLAGVAAELEEQKALAEQRRLELGQRGEDSISLPNDAIRVHFLSA